MQSSIKFARGETLFPKIGNNNMVDIKLLRWEGN